MKAMIFAAGRGTRLQPLTNKKPKALIEINGITMLELVIGKLKKYGISEFVINVHHFADQIIDFLNKKNNFNSIIHISDEREMLLETGGGLKKAEKFLSKNDEDFLVYNVDIFSNIDIFDLVKFHKKSKAIVTLAMQKRNSSRQLLFDEKNYLCAWKNILSGEIKKSRLVNGKLKSLAFSGIHLINPKIFKLISETGKFSIIDMYLRIAKNYKISAYKHNYSSYLDLGKHESIRKAEKEKHFFNLKNLFYQKNPEMK